MRWLSKYVATEAKDMPTLSRGQLQVYCRQTNETKIISLKIYCPNRSKGCDKITTMSECNQHLEKCLFVEVSCTKKCGERMLRKELQDHEDNKCPNRLVLCQYCNTKGMHKEIIAKSHTDQCDYFLFLVPKSVGMRKYSASS